MDTSNIKILLNQWKRQTKFKSLIHSTSSNKYKKYDQMTKIAISILGIFSTFDIIFSREFKDGDTFNVLNILGIIAVILITALSAFELHIKYSDQAEHHHILAILYSQINRTINSFLIKNGSTTRDETFHFYNHIQEQLYIIGTMDCECTTDIEDKTEKQMKDKSIDNNSILMNKKKNKYTDNQKKFINNLSVVNLQNIIKIFCKNEDINFKIFNDIIDKKTLINISQIDLNIPFVDFQKIYKNNNDVILQIQDENNEEKENYSISNLNKRQTSFFFRKNIKTNDDKYCVNILCVDDDPVHNKILKNIFKEKKWNFEYTCCPRDGFNKFLLKKYNIIMVDYKMPIMNGIEFTNMIRTSNNVNNNIIIVGMSAYDDEDIKQKCIESGMNTFITKPIIKSKLHLLTQYI
jgi:CheY-like chemotaxis protein|tara:strand:+ start:8114 stop:9334 length:1221 start_codon:yes stop_codon:yes gene_type:complete